MKNNSVSVIPKYSTDNEVVNTKKYILYKIINIMTLVRAYSVVSCEVCKLSSEFSCFFHKSISFLPMSRQIVSLHQHSLAITFGQEAFFSLWLGKSKTFFDFLFVNYASLLVCKMKNYFWNYQQHSLDLVFSAVLQVWKEHPWPKTFWSQTLMDQFRKRCRK